jgi:hypothetical protein
MTKKQTGRPSAYKPEFKEQAYKFALLGLTDKQMADIFEVSEQTFNDWKKKKDGFLESLKNGKEVADCEVSKSLYKRANGYSYNETTKELRSYIDEDGLQKNELVTTKIVKKEVSPDTGAAMAWLNNRQPALWRSKKEVLQTNLNVETTYEELEQIAAKEGITVDELADREGFDLGDLDE